MLSSAKTIKMLGLQGVVEKYILGLREKELNKAKHVRWIMSIYNASGLSSLVTISLPSPVVDL